MELNTILLLIYYSSMRAFLFASVIPVIAARAAAFTYTTESPLISLASKVTVLPLMQMLLVVPAQVLSLIVTMPLSVTLPL